MSAQQERRVPFLESVVSLLGYPTWVLEVLTTILFIFAFAVQMFITSTSGNIISYGSTDPNSMTGVVLAYLPATCFVAAVALCALRRAHKTLIVVATTLLAYGTTHGAYTSSTPSQHWAWGVVLALGCLLLPAVSKLCWWLLALVWLDRPVRGIKNVAVRWGTRQFIRVNSRVNATSA